ncbi:MAG TPA: amidohydrolase, partial [Firmicutes bacterium]|nr:amidohydrolase [Bacillota bacterium]
DALKTITINPAEIIGVADRVGSLEKGKDADIVIWSGDPTETATKCEKVIVNGELVVGKK